MAAGPPQAFEDVDCSLPEVEDEDITPELVTTVGSP
jgi:hypothetical protein